MKNSLCIVIILFVILTVGASEDEEEQFYEIDESNLILKQLNPLESDKKLWLNPSDDVLITTRTKLFNARRDTININFRELPNAIGHVVRYTPELRIADARYITPDFEKHKIVNNSFEELRKLPDNYPTIVYPEIMVVVAFDLYEKFKLNPWKIIPYLLSFWNSVDMRYRFLENPRYRLNIKQIVLESEPGILSYIKGHINSTNYLSYNCLQDSTKFWYDQKDVIPLDSYDLVVTMTYRKICGFYKVEEEKCTLIVYGQTFLSSACHIDHERKSIKKVAIVNDNGAYFGVTTTAHEIGHLLGAYDDGYSFINHETNTNGPSHCSYQDSFIMSPTIQSSANIFSWSKCSREDMEKFIKNESSQCLRNKPDGFKYPIARFLPGKLMDANQQCQRNGATGICGNVTSICTMLQCHYPEKGCVKSNVPIADGTLCDPNAINDICLYGQCVPHNYLN